MTKDDSFLYNVGYDVSEAEILQFNKKSVVAVKHEHDAKFTQTWILYKNQSFIFIKKTIQKYYVETELHKPNR